MRMNRRNVLLGLGTIVASGGAALGTGAFSQVEAEREITIAVDGDSAAFVSITPNANTDLVTTTANGELLIQWDSAEFGGSGVHQNATITIDEAIDFSHNGDNGEDYEVTLGSSGLSGSESVEFTGVTNPLTLTDGDSETAGLEITTDNGDLNGTLTISITEINQ